MTPARTGIVRAEFERLCADFSLRVRSLGLERTKADLWTRRQPRTVDVVHLHRHGSTYGAARNASVDVRVHFGIRVLNDAFGTIALNGPSTDAAMVRNGRYHLRFNAETGHSYDRCLDDLVRTVVEQGEPWFRTFRSVDALVGPDSPLDAQAKQALQSDSSGLGSADNAEASLRLLGIR